MLQSLTSEFVTLIITVSLLAKGCGKVYLIENFQKDFVCLKYVLIFIKIFKVV